MQIIRDTKSFYKRLYSLTTLLEKYKSFPLKDAKIIKLAESIFNYIGKHPGLKSDPKVIKVYKIIASLKGQEDLSTEGKTDRVISHRMPYRLQQALPITREAKSTTLSPLSVIPARAASDPPGDFIVDKGAAGDCAALSLLYQLQQRGILQPSNQLPFSTQQEVRVCVSSYLCAHIADITEEQVGTIYQSLREAQQDGFQLPSNLQTILNTEAHSTAPISHANKLTLVTGYADLIQRDGFWVDKGFFEVAASALGTQIVILRSEQATSDILVYDRFPRNSIDPARSLFIYYNGVVGGSRGNHFQSIELSHKQKLSALVNKDKETAVINFIEAVKEQKDPLKTKEQRRSGLKTYLEGLQKLYPEAYKAVWSLIKERSKSYVIESDGISKNVMSILFTLSSRSILKKIQAEKIHESSLPQSIAPEDPREGPLTYFTVHPQLTFFLENLDSESPTLELPPETQAHTLPDQPPSPLEKTKTPILAPSKGVTDEEIEGPLTHSTVNPGLTFPAENPYYQYLTEEPPPSSQLQPSYQYHPPVYEEPPRPEIELRSYYHATTAKVLFNLLADEFGKNSHLEGLASKEILFYVTDFIKQQRSLSISFSEILSELEMACWIETKGLSRALAEALGFKIPFVIVGGWIGLPMGHTVYYEVLPQKDSTVNLRIFNTGDGIQEHKTKRAGIKEKVAYLEWKGISLAKIEHPNFSRILQEMRKETHHLDPEDYNSTMKQTDYSAKDLYQSLKSYLQPTSITEGPQTSLMQPQQAGTCACRALFAFLKSKLSLQEYQRLKLDLRIAALSSFIQKPEDPALSREVQYHLVTKARAKLSRRVNDLFTKKVIEPATLMVAKQQLERADEWLAAHRVKKPDLSMAGKLISPLISLSYEKSPPIIDLLATPSAIPPIEAPLSSIMSQIGFYPLDNPQTFTDNIQKVSAIVNAAYINKEYTAVHFAIIDIVKGIPLDKDFWSDLKKTQPEIEDAINAVAILSELFFKSCYRIKDSKYLLGEKQYALKKLIFAQEKLAQFIYDQVFLKFCYVPTNSDSFYSEVGSVFLENFDPEIEKEMDVLQNDSKKSPFFSDTAVEKQPVGGLRYIINHGDYARADDKAPFIELIKERYPEIFQKIKENHLGFDYQKISHQNTIIFLSPYLPSWIQSLKKSSLCLAFMENIFIVPFKDPSISLDFHYENRGFEALISLEGITPENFTQLQSAERERHSWSANHAPIKEPMIERLINNIIYKILVRQSKSKEKQIYSPRASSYEDINYDIYSFQKYNSPHIPKRAVNELIHNFTSSSHCLIETLAYFTRHPDKINDPDYQQLFQLACFNSKFSKQIDIFKQQISTFLTKKITTAQNDEDVKTQVFLQRMGRYFRRYKCAAPDETSYLIKLVSDPKTSAEEKSLIYAELAAALGEQKELTAEQGELLLKAKAWIEHAPISSYWKDPQTAYDMQHALCRHAQTLTELLLPEGIPNTPLLNKIYSLITEKSPREDLTWEPTHTYGMSPRFRSNDSDFYDPMSGRLTSIGLESYIPLDILDQLDFQELFPHQLKGIALSADIYEFMHEGSKVIVRKTEHGLCFEQYKDGNWLRFIPKDQLIRGDRGNVIYALESRYLIDKYQAWYSLKNPKEIFLFDKKTNTKTHKIFYIDNYTPTILRISDGAHLNKPSKALIHFEHPSYIQEWYQGGKRIEIELPRFKLSFKPDVEGRLECAQHPGFFLSEGPNVEAVGECKYALILKNTAGKIRVLLPNQDLEIPSYQESLEPQFTRNQALKKGESADFTYFTYDLTSRGYLECSSKEGYFTLAKTLAVHQDYKKAAYYIKKYAKKLSAYSQQEVESLEEIAKISSITGDKSGEQVAIALYATYLLSTNEIHSDSALKTLPKLYKEYLLRLRNVTALKLSKDEELHILKSLLVEPLAPEFALRLSELDPTSIPVIRTISPVIDADKSHTIKLSNIENLIHERVEKPLPYSFLNSKYPLITRPANFIKKHLIQIVNLAIRGSDEEKKWIESASYFLTLETGNFVNTSLGSLLQIILKNPEIFPPPPNPSSSYESRKKWWYEALDIAEEVASVVDRSSRLSVDSPIVGPLIRSTDRDPIQIPDLPFIFTPSISPNLIEIEPFSTWSTQSREPISENRELTEFLSSQKPEDPVESAEWSRLQEDAKAFYAKPAKTLYSIETALPEIPPILQAKKTEIEKALISIERDMITLAETPPADPVESALFLVQKGGQLLQKITADDIFISLALKDPKKLLEQNPHLSEQNLTDLYKLAADYLQLASKAAQVDRILSLCDNISQGQTEELKQDLAQQLNTKRCYDIQKHPEYLVFEYYAGILMRDDQVAKLNDFLERKTSNPVMEMIMGSGKSKVLLPLLGLLRADGKDLSMVVVPAPLFESISSDTQQILQKAFSKSLTTLHFDRNSTFTKRSIEEIKTFLTTVIDKKQCLIMTSKSIQCLMLKFIEYTNSLKAAEAPESEELKLMIDIISLLQTAGNPLIDEADSVLNVLHEVSFSLGQKSPPKEEEIQLIGTLYELLYSEPSLKSIARLESDPHPLEKDPSTEEPIPPLSKKLYDERLKSPLAKALIRKLIEQQKLPRDVDQDALFSYLCRDESKSEKSQSFFDKQEEYVQNLLALAAEELCSMLPHTLLKTGDERYGLDNQVIAIPYSAANTPSHGSVFSNPYITMNYTFQIHAKNGIQEDLLVGMVQQLKIQADIQMREEGILLQETDGYKGFNLLKGDLEIPFKRNLHPRDLKLILERINTHPEIRQGLITKLFLPQMQLFEKKIACNPINLIGLFSKVSGFTGTLWNAASLHRKLAPQPEPGTDAKTLKLLMQKAVGPARIIHKVAAVTMFDELPPHDALIDAGGYFKEGGNLEIARKMSLKYNKPVVFYNSKAEQTVTYEGMETSLSASSFKEEQRLTFYDQSHTTGADIKQKGEAVGLVTIGRGMILRDLLQSVWRLRGLEKGQTVQFVIDEEVASIIRGQLGIEGEEIGFKEILKFAIQNQGKQQGDDNFKAFKQQLDNISQNLLLEVMTNAEYSPEEKLQAFSYLSTTWIKPANLTPFQLYGKPASKRPSTEVIEEATQKCSAQLRAIDQQLPFLKIKAASLMDEIKSLTDIAKTRVHSQVISNESESEGTAEVEQATQVETQVSTEIETEVENELEKIALGIVIGTRWEHMASRSEIPIFSEKGKAEMLQDKKDPKTTNPTGLDFIPLFPIADQMESEPDLESYKDLFKGIDISINALEWTKGRIEKMRLLGPYKIPYNHVIIDGDKVTLFSQHEEITADPNYYNLTLGFKDPRRKPSLIALEKVVKIKFLDGESFYNKEEIAVLESWLRRSDVKKMETLYLKHILKYQPDKKMAFEGSQLERLFKRLKP